MSHAATEPITPLRQRMIEDMKLRKLSAKTQTSYVRHVKEFTRYLGRSPDSATAEDLRRYQLHLVEQGISSGNLNAKISGLKFFFENTLDRAQVTKKLRHVHEPRKIPVILSLEEVTRLLQSAGSPKCQGSAARRWLAERQADLLPVDYYHLVFTLPAPISDIAYTNQSVIYCLLFQAAAETLITIAADPKHLGARIGLTLVLHTWGSAMTHHPHVHGIVPGGGVSLDGAHWIGCRPGFFLPVRVLSRLFRRRFLERLAAAHRAAKLQFFGEHRPLADSGAFENWLEPLRQQDWVVYAKRPFAGPAAVLAYLSRYTHRVAIANSRLLSMDERGVRFKWKDYRVKGRYRQKTMTLAAGEFIRRFLLHVLPKGLHRIRHYGLNVNTARKHNLARARELLGKVASQQAPIEVDTASQTDQTGEAVQTTTSPFLCPECGAAMEIVESFAGPHLPRAPPGWGPGP